jgi:aspartyl-tRNA(Asn)/glutamyl-tRNA(Gln) amidotransferase subunit C
MAISTDDVLHVARLARLSLTPEEVERMAGQLSAVLGHVEQLRRLDLAGVEPTAHALDVANVTRPDRSRPSFPRDEALAGAPSAQDGAFRVPPAS